jgi:hypothetical protein
MKVKYYYHKGGTNNFPFIVFQFNDAPIKGLIIYPFWKVQVYVGPINDGNESMADYEWAHEVTL